MKTTGGLYGYATYMLGRDALFAILMPRPLPKRAGVLWRNLNVDGFFYIMFNYDLQAPKMAYKFSTEVAPRG